jgi:hypothetical protein
MKPRLDIRALRPDERHSWEPLWQGYLTFYESEVTPEVTTTTWAGCTTRPSRCTPSAPSSMARSWHRALPVP